MIALLVTINRVTHMRNRSGDESAGAGEWRNYTAMKSMRSQLHPADGEWRKFNNDSYNPLLQGHHKWHCFASVMLCSFRLERGEILICGVVLWLSESVRCKVRQQQN